MSFYSGSCLVFIIILLTSQCDFTSVVAVKQIGKESVAYTVTPGLVLQSARGSTTGANGTNSSGPGGFLNNSIVQLVTGISLVSGLAGFFLTRFFDFWTAKAKERHEFQTHVAQHIEQNAPGYFLMSNYADLLSSKLNQYVEYKRMLQLAPIAIAELATTLRNDLDEGATYAAKECFFFTGFLFRIMTDSFWIKGGTYFLPDSWASLAIDDLHNNLMKFVPFDRNIALKYINSTKVQEYQFYEKLEDNEKNTDLYNEYIKYKQWLLREDEQVKHAAAASFAYSELLKEQMDRLYKRRVSDTRKASEVNRSSYLGKQESHEGMKSSRCI